MESFMFFQTTLEGIGEIFKGRPRSAFFGIISNNIKIFVVYSKVQFDEESIPLKIFREEYDEPYELHITFTQPVYINDSEIDVIKKLLLGLGKPKTKVNIKLTHLKESEDLLMLEVEKNKMLVDLQSRISNLLNNYNDYVDIGTKTLVLNSMR